MAETTMDEKRCVCGSADDGGWGRAEMTKALRLMSYVNCLPRTRVLESDKRVRKGN